MKIPVEREELKLKERGSELLGTTVVERDRGDSSGPEAVLIGI